MLKHFFTNSFGILTSRVLGFIRDLMIAASLGAGVWSDIFLVAFKLPNLFRRMFGEGAFVQAFLPNFVKAKQKSLFLSEILFKFIAIMLSLSAFVMIFAPFVTKLIAYGFDDATLALAVSLVRINFWYLICIFVVTLFASVLQNKNHFATTAFGTALLNVAMILALILSKNLEQSKIVYWLSYGVVIGGILQVIAHILAMIKLNLWRLVTLGLAQFFKGKRAGIKGFWINFSQGIIGSSAMQVSDFISTIIASFLVSGSISYLYYANRIFQLPLGIFAIALATTIFPKITRQIKLGSDKEAINLLTKAFNILFFLLLFSAVGGAVLSKEIIWLLFERGEFSSQNTSEAAIVLSMAMIGLVPFGLYSLFSKWLYAKFKQKQAAKISVYSLFVNVGLCLALFRFGAAGLALAGSLSGLFLFLSAVKIFGFKDFLAIIWSKKTLLSIILAIIFGIFLYYLKVFIYANL